jgi:hypothetical protein
MFKSKYILPLTSQMTDDNSPLRFIDMDASRYLYETYFPSLLMKQQFNQVVNQLKYFRKEKLEEEYFEFKGLPYEYQGGPYEYQGD